MRILRNPDGFADHLEFSADSRWLMAARHSIRLWGMPSGEERHLMSERVLAARFAGGEVAAVVGGRPGDLRRFSLTGEPLGQTVFVGWTDNRLTVSPGAGRVALIDGHARDGNIAQWAWPDLKPLAGQYWPGDGRHGAARDVRFSPDGRHLALIDSNPRVALRTPDGATVWEKAVTGRNDYGRLAWSPDGRFLAAASGIHLNILAPATGEEVARLRLKIKYYQDMAFTPDGRFLATVSNEKTVKVYETATWSLREELAWSIGKLACIAISPDGMLGAVGNVGKKILVWDIDW